MKKILIIGLLLAVVTSYGQVGDIKIAGGGSGCSGGGCGGGDFSGCGDAGGACFWNIGAFIVNGGLMHHSELMSHRHEVFRTLSIHAKLAGGTLPGKNILIMPEVRGNWGLFSTDLRLSQLSEPNESYTTFDWQILQLNFVQTRDINFRVGSGFMSDIQNKKYYYEHSIGLDGFIADNKYTLGCELRYAHDYSPARLDMHISGGVRLKEMPHQKIYFTGGAYYQNYFSVVDNWGIKGAIEIYIH